MTLRERLDALMTHSAQEVEPAASVRAYREFAVACAEAYRAGLLVVKEEDGKAEWLACCKLAARLADNGCSAFDVAVAIAARRKNTGGME